MWFERFLEAESPIRSKAFWSRNQKQSAINWKSEAKCQKKLNYGLLSSIRSKVGWFLEQIFFRNSTMQCSANFACITVFCISTWQYVRQLQYSIIWLESLKKYNRLINGLYKFLWERKLLYASQPIAIRNPHHQKSSPTMDEHSNANSELSPRAGRMLDSARMLSICETNKKTIHWQEIVNDAYYCAFSMTEWPSEPNESSFTNTAIVFSALALGTSLDHVHPSSTSYIFHYRWFYGPMKWGVQCRN